MPIGLTQGEILAAIDFDTAPEVDNVPSERTQQIVAEIEAVDIEDIPAALVAEDLAFGSTLEKVAADWESFTPSQKEELRDMYTPDYSDPRGDLGEGANQFFATPETDGIPQAFKRMVADTAVKTDNPSFGASSNVEAEWEQRSNADRLAFTAQSVRKGLPNDSGTLRYFGNDSRARETTDITALKASLPASYGLYIDSLTHRSNSIRLQEGETLVDGIMRSFDALDTGTRTSFIDGTAEDGIRSSTQRTVPSSFIATSRATGDSFIEIAANWESLSVAEQRREWFTHRQQGTVSQELSRVSSADKKYESERERLGFMFVGGVFDESPEQAREAYREDQIDIQRVRTGNDRDNTDPRGDLGNSNERFFATPEDNQSKPSLIQRTLAGITNAWTSFRGNDENSPTARQQWENDSVARTDAIERQADVEAVVVDDIPAAYLANEKNSIVISQLASLRPDNNYEAVAIQAWNNESPASKRAYLEGSIIIASVRERDRDEGGTNARRDIEVVIEEIVDVFTFDFADSSSLNIARAPYEEIDITIDSIARNSDGTLSVQYRAAGTDDPLLTQFVNIDSESEELLPGTNLSIANRATGYVIIDNTIVTSGVPSVTPWKEEGVTIIAPARKGTAVPITSNLEAGVSGTINMASQETPDEPLEGGYSSGSSGPAGSTNEMSDPYGMSGVADLFADRNVPQNENGSLVVLEEAIKSLEGEVAELETLRNVPGISSVVLGVMEDDLADSQTQLERLLRTRVAITEGGQPRTSFMEANVTILEAITPESSRSWSDAVMEAEPSLQALAEMEATAIATLAILDANITTLRIPVFGNTDDLYARPIASIDSIAMAAYAQAIQQRKDFVEETILPLSSIIAGLDVTDMRAEFLSQAGQIADVEAQTQINATLLAAVEDIDAALPAITDKITLAEDRAIALREIIDAGGAQVGRNFVGLETSTGSIVTEITNLIDLYDADSIAYTKEGGARARNRETERDVTIEDIPYTLNEILQITAAKYNQVFDGIDIVQIVATSEARPLGIGSRRHRYADDGGCGCAIDFRFVDNNGNTLVPRQNPEMFKELGEIFVGYTGGSFVYGTGYMGGNKVHADLLQSSEMTHGEGHAWTHDASLNEATLAPIRTRAQARVIDGDVVIENPAEEDRTGVRQTIDFGDVVEDRAEELAAKRASELTIETNSATMSSRNQANSNEGFLNGIATGLGNFLRAPLTTAGGFFSDLFSGDGTSNPSNTPANSTGGGNDSSDTETNVTDSPVGETAAETALKSYCRQIIQGTAEVDIPAFCAEYIDLYGDAPTTSESSRPYPDAEIIFVDTDSLDNVILASSQTIGNSCMAMLDELTTSAATASLETLRLLYRDLAGEVIITNPALSETLAAVYLDLQAFEVAAFLGQEFAMFHTHPLATGESLGAINPENIPPSALDYNAICTVDDILGPNLKNYVVDTSGIWQYSIDTTNCIGRNLTNEAFVQIALYEALQLSQRAVTESLRQDIFDDHIWEVLSFLRDNLPESDMIPMLESRAAELAEPADAFQVENMQSNIDAIFERLGITLQRVTPTDICGESGTSL